MTEKTTQLSAVVVDPLVMRRKTIEYFDAAKPFIDAKIAIYSTEMPTVIIRAGNEVQQRYNFTSEQRESLRLADEAIDAIKETIFGTEQAPGARKLRIA